MDKSMNYLDGNWTFIFDMDGLMLDSELIAHQAWQRAGADFGYVLTDEMMLECVGSSSVLSEMIQKKYLGLDYPFQNIRERKMIYFEKSIMENGISVKKGLIELLDLLESKQIHKVVASSTEQPHVNQRLKITNLLHRFDAIVSGSDVEKVKPDPALFLKAARLIGAEPRQCMVLEDSPIGVKAADAAGMLVILVPDRAPIPAEISSMVVGVFPSLDDVRLYLLGQP